MAKPTKQSYSLEFKLAVVQRFLAGETEVELARELDVSSPKLIETWARKYRNEGEEGLRPKPKGRRKQNPAAPVAVSSQLARLQRENEPGRRSSTTKPAWPRPTRTQI